jgi:hypothetical protein
MKLLEKCPICGGELVEKEVEKVLRGGANTAILNPLNSSGQPDDSTGVQCSQSWVLFPILPSFQHSNIPAFSSCLPLVFASVSLCLT